MRYPKMLKNEMKSLNNEFIIKIEVKNLILFWCYSNSNLSLGIAWM